MGSNLHKTIRNKRVELNISQCSLAALSGCSQSHISRVEAGTTSIKHELLDRIIEHLRTSLRLVKYPKKDIDLIEEAKELLEQQRFFDLKAILTSIVDKGFFRSNSAHKILLRLRGLVEFHCNRNVFKASNSFIESIQKPIESHDEKLQDAETFNAIANCLTELGHLDLANKFYCRSISHLEALMITSKHSYLKIHVLFNWSRLLRRQGFLSAAKSKATEAIHISLFTRQYHFLSQLYYQTAMIYNQQLNLDMSRYFLFKSRSLATELCGVSLFPYINAFEQVLKMNEAGLWEYNDQWLTGFTNEEIFQIYNAKFV